MNADSQHKHRRQKNILIILTLTNLIIAAIATVTIAANL